MPTDIMPSVYREENFIKNIKKNDAEVKSGFCVLIAPSRMRQDVRVVVYKTSLEHFAVIYPRKRLSKPVGVVNLRNTAVEQAEANGFIVRQKGYDNTIAAKFICSEREVASWMSAFTSKSHANTSLPVLIETEES